MSQHQVSIKIELKKADAQSRTITGWAAVVTGEDGVPIIDSDDHVIPIAVLEKSVHQAFANTPGRGRVGVNHEERGKADLVESFVLTAEKRAALGLGESGKEGWIVTLRVRDPEVIRRVESGELRELSLKGIGKGRVV